MDIFVADGSKWDFFNDHMLHHQKFGTCFRSVKNGDLFSFENVSSHCKGSKSIIKTKIRA